MESRPNIRDIHCPHCGAECAPNLPRCWMCKNKLGEASPHSTDQDQPSRKRVKLIFETSFLLISILVVVVGVALAMDHWGHLFYYGPVSVLGLMAAAGVMHRFVDIGLGLLLSLLVFLALFVAFAISCANNPIYVGP